MYSEMLRSFLLIVRKKDGYEDLNGAIRIFKELKELQNINEKRFLDKKLIQDERDLHIRISTVVALYNLIKLLQITAEFLCGLYENKNISSKGLKGEIDRYVLNARELLQRGINPHLRILSYKLAEACKQLIDASVYSVIMPPRTRKFLLSLSNNSKRPVLELWYSQREALKQSLLDPTKSAIVISMPTSSGKTLLAELAILQAYNDDPESKIIYLAPTRALVTQISLTLKRHLGNQMTIRIATPSFELNPIEDAFLSQEFNVLVTTPEKLDLLVRTEHQSVKQVSLVVVDEAHNINEKERGARLELLLATLKRERPRTRFLLLTPFAKNAHDLSYWLGEDQGVPIVIDWKPNDRIVGSIKPGLKIRNKNARNIVFETLKSVQSDYPNGEDIPIGCYIFDNRDIQSKELLCVYAALGWAKAKNGGVLLLAASRQKAQERASWLTKHMPERQYSRSVDLVCRFLETELGSEQELIKMLKKGVAFHHSGLSSESRYFIERLVEIGEIKILYATTTIAQGLNFPLSVAIIEEHTRSKKRGQYWVKEEIEPWEFWNIAGRVGRTFEDTLGTVAFSHTKADQKARIENYLSKDASIVTSTLLDLVVNLGGKDNIYFGTNLLENIKSASAFLQYIVHALSVSGVNDVKADLEGILRTSFVFEQARSENPKLAEELIRVARLYIDELEKKKGKALPAFVKLADGTGFSSPSVDEIWKDWKVNKNSSLSDWNAENLFPADGGESDTLINAIETLSRIPEMRLGTEETGEFDAERIARITSAWVNGESIITIANNEYGGDIYKCVSHINSTVANLIPWGIRGIQRVSFVGQNERVWEQLDLIPAMIYHGVKSEEAIALRMLNVPRIVAEGLSKQWREQQEEHHKDIFNWFDDLSDKAWENALPKGSKINGRECKFIWEVIEGKKQITDIQE